MDFLRIEQGDDGIAVIRMDRPPVNSVNEQMYVEIKTLFSSLVNHVPNARVVILTGTGKHFCAGNDLADFQTMTPENAGERMKRVREAFFAISDAELPVIGAVHGVAVGTGLAIAASCDILVAAEGAKLGLPEVNVGVMGGASHARRILPQPLVRYLHLTGEPLPAEEFARFGAIFKVVPPDQLMAEARAIATKIARHSPVTLRFAKKSLNTIESMELKPAYEFEQGLSGELSGYADAKEAVNAFFERRAPVYTGR